MPYIGRNHIAGDHTSNFKVLDDISSYTATFNGSGAVNQLKSNQSRHKAMLSVKNKV